MYVVINYTIVWAWVWLNLKYSEANKFIKQNILYRIGSKHIKSEFFFFVLSSSLRLSI